MELSLNGIVISALGTIGSFCSVVVSAGVTSTPENGNSGTTGVGYALEDSWPQGVGASLREGSFEATYGNGDP